MGKRTEYDIFISYRRESFNQANLISTRLKALGYRVFIDVEALNSGKFNEQLLKVIKNCKDFLVVLPPGALDRCVNNDDWVRREVMCAMENKKNIVPIMLAGFEWPNPMPEGMEDLCLYQSLAPMPDVYFDMQIQKLQGYLKSKAYFRKRNRWIKGLSIVAAVIAVILIIGYITYKPVAQKLADSLLLRTEQMREYDEIDQQGYQEWEQYLNDYKNAPDEEGRQDAVTSFLKILGKLEKESNTLLKTMQQNKIEVSKFHLPVFALQGIPAVDLLLFDMYTESCFDELNNSFNYYREVIEEGDYSLPVVNMAKVNRVVNRASVEMYYYQYLSTLTHLPESTHERFYQLSPEWTNMPQTGLGLSSKEYERLTNMASEKASQEIKKQKGLTEIEKERLDAMEKQVEELMKQGEEIDCLLDSLAI